MSKVVFDISMSLDGYIAASNRRPEEPLGDGGERLHEWVGHDREYLERAITGLGAVITGRENYDSSVPWWGADGPSGPARRPVFVLTHKPPAESPENGVYTFVTGGIESALAQARAVAGDRAVTVMGGADVARQYLAAGLVDEISVHVVPVLFGSGTRLFEHPHCDHIQLETVDVVETAAAIHTRFRVLGR